MSVPKREKQQHTDVLNESYTFWRGATKRKLLFSPSLCSFFDSFENEIRWEASL
jgi:hypothetical protein